MEEARRTSGSPEDQDDNEKKKSKHHKKHKKHKKHKSKKEKKAGDSTQTENEEDETPRQSAPQIQYMLPAGVTSDDFKAQMEFEKQKYRMRREEEENIAAVSQFLDKQK